MRAVKPALDKADIEAIPTARLPYRFKLMPSSNLINRETLANGTIRQMALDQDGPDSAILTEEELLSLVVHLFQMIMTGMFGYLAMGL